MSPDHDAPAAGRVTVYVTGWCVYCLRAKSILQRRGVAWTEVDIDASDGGRAAMVALSGGRRTVPQVFVGLRHVGGADDLAALDRSGGLLPLLEQQGVPHG